DTTARFPAEDILTVFPAIEPVTEPQIIEELPIVIPSAGRALPVGVLPRHVLTASQSFIYTIPEDEMRYFYSFRWLKPPPKGMFFHYESRSITWIPSPDQLGAYQLAYQVEMKIGEKIAFDSLEPDSLMTYQVVPDLDGYEERLWVYVNDQPQIISEPTGVDFVADELFTYQPQAVDANADARITFTLEQKPAGMTIAPDGFISWQTDSTHVTVYQVRLVASDGFER
ncbi:MAG: hypothetical protein GY869_04330, partial [Planctomycetes bacterium]|nr:hypothetical protein [Planctomycetota bacterium]